MSVGNFLSGVIMFGGLFTVKASSMPFLGWICFFMLLIVIAAGANWFYDTKVGVKFKKKQDKWIGKHSKKQFGNQSHSVQ